MVQASRIVEALDLKGARVRGSRTFSAAALSLPDKSTDPMRTLLHTTCTLRIPPAWWAAGLYSVRTAPVADLRRRCSRRTSQQCDFQRYGYRSIIHGALQSLATILRLRGNRREREALRAVVLSGACSR